MPADAATTRLGPGETVARRELRTIAGVAFAIPDESRLIHLQFRRFAGCPVCNLHLRSIVRRHGEIAAAGIREVVVFHSSVADLLVHAPGLPFDVVADPAKRLYAAFGVETSPRAVLDPRAWPSIAAGVVSSALAMLTRGAPAPPINAPGGSLGLPADFLLGTDGTVLARKYGEHADDQWSVDELLTLAASGHGR